MYLAKKYKKIPLLVLKNNALFGERSVLKGNYAMYTKSNGCDGNIIALKGHKKENELFSIKYLNPYECNKDTYTSASDFPNTVEELKNENGLHNAAFLENILPMKIFEPIEYLVEDNYQFEKILSEYTLKPYICNHGAAYVALAHNYLGWQQFIDGYVYRDISNMSVIKISNNNAVPCFWNDDENYDENVILSEYTNMMNILKFTEYDFSITLLLYMLFGKIKSLFKQYSYNKKIVNQNDFFLHIDGTNNPNENKKIIEYVSYLNKNFFQPTDENFKYSSVTAINKGCKLKINHIHKSAIIRDVPIFKFMTNSKYDFLEKGMLTDIYLTNALNSQIAYIFFNLKSIPDQTMVLHHPQILNIMSSDLKTMNFSNLITDYLCYISEKISSSITEDEKKRRKELITDYQTTYNDMQLVIEKYVEHIFLKLADKSIDKTIKFIQLMKSSDYKRYLKQFNDDNDNKFQFFRNINIDYYKRISSESPAHYIGKYKKLNGLTDYAKEKYNECIINEYLKTPKYHHKYFDDLYMKSYQELLSSNADKIKAKRYAFLLATLESLKEYIHECLSEKEKHFDDFYKNAHNIILGQCKFVSYSGEKGLLKLFAEFIQNKITDGKILDKNSEIKAKLGWIDYKKNELLLRNTPIFYQEFDSYMYDKGEILSFNKTEFVRTILAGNHLISERQAGKIKRFDRTRKINGSKVEVLVINLERLMLHLKL